MSNSPHMITPLNKVRGLGSAKHGVGHWWAQRLTAIALIPLGIWFLASIVALTGTTHRALEQWFSSPFTATAMLCLMGAMLYHAKLGLQVVIEDYIQCEGLKLGLLIALRFAAIIGAIVSALAIFTLHTA